ncbi:ABC transporter permease [Halalkalicoccus jeotgali]|uniref:ABC-type transport system permease n=1 Tax=Halalkalicoccus jeotgali (strain DSM 18796 / CECT 7217 / JCM 14584 / KCTC 4019 / B3) TaxID=795797 RepID=D8J7L0_HALJB|nr:ABC transporter permease [Halalkalicoccus jeotgali]ADJ16030.1 ABC-type transport system permease protein (probable substrate sugar) [Halalkalicoccus jeotgali B3]ELY38126.1 ABC-type transport system permease [Halalkalicoccus jeotgali B3]
MSDWRERTDASLDWLVNASAVQRILASLTALVFAVLVGTVLVFVSGFVADCSDPFIYIPGVGYGCYNPVEMYGTMINGAFGSLTALGRTLQETTLLLFTGLSVAVAFRAGLFNIGTQGQMVLGALAAALTVIALGDVVPATIVGALVVIPVGIVVGALVGGFWGMIPGVMKAYADAHEVITTIMLNFVATGIAFWAVQNHVGNLETDSVQTHSIPELARLPATISGARFSIYALLGALLIAVGIYLLYTRTVLGYELRTSGIQETAAEYGGVNAKRNIVTSMTLSGALGGVAGAIYVTMIQYRWQAGIPALGFDGIAVSILAGNNPLGVIPAALLFGGMKTGSVAVDLSLGVPNELVEVLRGLIILFIAMPEFFRMLGKRAGYGGGEAE